MEFEGQYLTYADYTNLGGTLDEPSFNLLEFEARRRIDEATHNRLVGQNDIPDEVKLCEFNIINNILEAYEGEISRGKNSETVGSYSVTYNNDMKQVVESKNNEILDMITTYLYGVIVNGEHLIYCGV